MIQAEIPHPAGQLEPRDYGRLPKGYDFGTKIAVAPLVFGTFAVRRVADGPEQAAPPSSAADVTLRPRGFVLQVADPHLGGPVVLGYDQGSPVTLVRRGRVWVPVEAAVTQDGAVFCRFTAGPGGSVLGAIRGNADGGTCAAIPRANFEIGGSKNALVSINL
jgi:hypothetical protein